MFKITDTKGKSWEINLGFNEIRALRRGVQLDDGTELKIDLLQFDDDTGLLGLSEVSDNPMVAVDLLYYLLRDQIADDAAAIELGKSIGTPADGGESVLVTFVERFSEEVFDYFPTGKRERIRALWAKMLLAEQAKTTSLVNQLTDPVIQEIMDKETAEKIKKLRDGKSPETKPNSPS